MEVRDVLFQPAGRRTIRGKTLRAWLDDQLRANASLGVDGTRARAARLRICLRDVNCLVRYAALQGCGVAMKVILAAGLCCLVTVIWLAPARAVDRAEAAKAATAAAEQWLELVDQGKFNGSWLEASTYFRNVTTKQQLKQQVSVWRSALGSVVSRRLRTVQYLTTMPGAPDGEYVMIQYDTSFTHKKSAVEVVVPMIDADGKWRVSEYSIR